MFLFGPSKFFPQFFRLRKQQWIHAQKQEDYHGVTQHTEDAFKPKVPFVVGVDCAHNGFEHAVQSEVQTASHSHTQNNSPPNFCVLKFGNFFFKQHSEGESDGNAVGGKKVACGAVEKACKSDNQNSAVNKVLFFDNSCQPIHQKHNGNAKGKPCDNVGEVVRAKVVA